MIDIVASKIYDWDTIKPRLIQWRLKSNRLVFTNGCFDILHYGHIHYLAQARTLGDRLIVGINSAESVKRLKGQHRPINDEMTRQHLLAALQFVDAVIPFEQDTPYELIRLIQPDVLVKGGDWSPEQIVGSDIVFERGGQVLSLDFVKGYSTTNIETKIKQS